MYRRTSLAFLHSDTVNRPSPQCLSRTAVKFLLLSNVKRCNPLLGAIAILIKIIIIIIIIN